MRLSQEHDPKYLRLGLILVFTGLLFALIIVSQVNARELNPSIFDTEAVLVSESDPLAVYGCDSALYFYPDSYSDSVLLSKVFNPDVEQSYNYWYGSSFLSSVSSWGFNSFGYDVLKGHIINLMSQTNYFMLPRNDTIANVQLKEIDLDDNYADFYFMDSNFNYYCYVSYVPQNSETLQPDFRFDSFTINSSGHFVEQDPVYRELFVWDFSNLRWVYSSVSSSDVVVHTVIKAPYVVRLQSGAQVYVEASRFLIDDPLPTSTPSPSPTTVPQDEYNILLNKTGSSYASSFLVCFNASGVLDYFTQPLNSSVATVLSESNTTSQILKYNALVKKTGSYEGSWLSVYCGEAFMFYIKCSSFSDIVVYKSNNTVFPSNDFDYIKQNYSSSSVSRGDLSNQNSSRDVYYYVSEVDDGYILCIVLRNGQYVLCSDYTVFSDIWFQEGTYYYNSTRVNNSIPFEENSGQYKLALKKMLDVDNNAVPDPNVTPTPTATPTPTEAPHVIITWPSGTPTPTPPFVIPSSPPFNPPGDGITPLDPELQEDVFSIFRSKIGDNNSFGLFSLLIGLLPGDLMWYIWFLLFVLLVVGVAKLIIHFTGG